MRGDKQERILRVLLNDKETLSKNEISKRANCTRPWVILFLKNLEKIALIKNTKILNKKKLLNYWKSIHKKPKKFRSYMVKEPLKLLKETNLDYALTTYQAENIVQHHLFPSRTDIYIKEKDLEKWHKLMTKNGLYGKGNVKIIIADEHAMYKKRKLNNLFVVSLPQIIIDLLTEGGPCEEAAEMLMKNV
jgi:DNA-binding Lrp family transcriptional regulator